MIAVDGSGGDTEYVTANKETKVTTATRTDTHKPSLLDPAEYAYAAAFYQGDSDEMMWSYREDMKEYDAALGFDNATGEYDAKIFDGNWKSKATCDHCGAHFNHGVLFMHKPTETFIHVGHICAHDTIGLPSKAAAAKKRAEKAARAAAEKAAQIAATQGWRDENPALVNFLNQVAADETAWRDSDKETLPKGVRAPHHFLTDMVHSFNRYGSLTERQAAATSKWIPNYKTFTEQVESAAAKNAEQDAKLADAPVLTAERREIVGAVKSTKWQSSDYGDTLKMLVEEDNGNRLWGTVPSAVDIEVGDVVAFTATITPSNDDGHFGFYKRPTGATVVSKNN